MPNCKTNVGKLLEREMNVNRFVENSSVDICGATSGKFELQRLLDDSMVSYVPTIRNADAHYDICYNLRTYFPTCEDCSISQKEDLIESAGGASRYRLDWCSIFDPIMLLLDAFLGCQFTVNSDSGEKRKVAFLPTW